MKTNITMLCSLLAAIAAAAAQDAPPAPNPPVAPVPPVPPAPPFARPAAATTIEVPALRAEQIADPVRWAYRMAGDLSEFPLPDRRGPVTFLGVNASPPPGELAPHLPIQEDTGLVIEFLTKDGPAAKAGLQERDVLAKLDDQILIHPRQLAVLVANHKEGDQVKITYVRKGKLQETTAVLGKHEPKPSAGLLGLVKDGPVADVLIQGQPGSPLKTFVRRIHMGDQGQAVEITGAPEPLPGVPGAAPAPPPDGDKAELQAIRKMLEDLTRRLESKE